MATPELIRDHYDSLALVYRAFWGDHIHHGLFEHGDETPQQAQGALVDYCLELVRPAVGSAVLDVGCGHGAPAVRLARELDCQVLGLTISEKQAYLARENAARARVQQRTRFLVQDAETYAYPHEEFDLVWTMESSEHFADKPRYLQNVAATLKPGGQLLLAAWTGSMESAGVRAVAAACLCPALWTAQEYCDAIAAAGLQLRSCEDLTAKVTRTWKVCSRRAQAARVAAALLPRPARDFVKGIELILAAYSSGELSYTILSAKKPGAGSGEGDG